MAVDKNVFQNAGDYTLDGVLIVGSSGEKINVISQVRELNIYQSIDSPFMSGNIMIADAQGVAEILPFLGQERLLFLLQTPSHEGTVDFNEYHAIIYNVGARIHQTDRSQTVVLHWTSIDNYKNIRTRVSKSFKGNIGNIVREILLETAVVCSNPNILVRFLVVFNNKLNKVLSCNVSSKPSNCAIKSGILKSCSLATSNNDITKLATVDSSNFLPTRKPRTISKCAGLTESTFV